jgi:hypothetical protein
MQALGSWPAQASLTHNAQHRCIWPLPVFQVLPHITQGHSAHLNTHGTKPIAHQSMDRRTRCGSLASTHIDCRREGWKGKVTD